MTSFASTRATGGRSRLAWLRRLGACAFLFFLLKGLLWLAAPLVFVWLV